MDRPVKSSKETHNAVNGKSPVKMPNKQQLKEMMMLEAGRMKLARICDDAGKNHGSAQRVDLRPPDIELCLQVPLLDISWLRLATSMYVRGAFSADCAVVPDLVCE